MHDLSLFLSVAILQTFPAEMNPSQAADLRLLQAIALVESGANPRVTGDNGRARGAWQMHRAAWIESNAWRKSRGMRAWNWGDWQNVQAQRETALAYIKIIQSGFEHNPGPKEIYLVYTMGRSGYNSYKERLAGNALTESDKRKVNAAERVEAIFLSAK